MIFNNRKIAYLLIVSLLIGAINPFNSFARILWPSEMNLESDNVNLDSILPEDATSSNSKKGFLFCGDPKEVFTLGAGHIAVNITLSGKGHAFRQYLMQFRERGIKITVVLVNDKAPVGIDTTTAPEGYKNPYFYMIDFYGSNGEWQRFNFDRIVEEYAPYVDNWIIGNEINAQLYNYYGPADVSKYTKVYCDSFKICYEKIKEVNPDANLFISFDQGWDMPEWDSRHRRFNKTLGQFRYNAKEQIALINTYLGKNIDWGISLHPYPAPVESAYFWDDEYAGFEAQAKDEKNRPYLLTLKNFDVAISYLAENKFLNRDNEIRKIIISEFALTSHDGEREQAAGLYYLWEKMQKYPFIVSFIYNSQTDLPDGYNFGLTSDKNKKRLIWAVFKDMDRKDENGWCKDLLDQVLDEYGYADFDGIIFSKASVSELMKKNK